MNGWRRAATAAAFLAAAIAVTPIFAQAAAPTIAPGDAQQSAVLPGATLPVFTYRPQGCAPHLLLLVFHGVGRNAAGYRDHARPLADRLCAIIVAPLFAKARFPRARYQYGGVMQDGAAVSPGRRTIDLVASLAAWAQRASGQPGIPYALIGHSAGAQFVDRVAAFAAIDAAHIVIANPSTWVLPSLAIEAPFGFGGLGTEASGMLRAYLARPVTVLLGGADTGTRWLATSKAAMAQGSNRYQRGENTFRMARAIADRNHWRFGWTLTIVPGVGHNAAAMFASPQAEAALTGRDPGSCYAVRSPSAPNAACAAASRATGTR